MKLSERLSLFFLKPPLWFDIAVWAAAIASIGVSVGFLCVPSRGGYPALISYVLSLVLIILSAYLILTFGEIPSMIRNNRHVKKFVADFGFRSYVFAVCSVVINTVYVVFGTIIAVDSGSAWLGALVWYRVILALSRATVVLTVKKHDKSGDPAYRLRCYLYSGLMLIVLAFALVTVVVLVARGENRYSFIGGAIVYSVALAAYSSIKFIMSFRNLRRAHKSGDLSLAALRNIGFADACISLFALQAVLFTVREDRALASVMNPLTGAVMCFVVFALGIYMIVRAIVKRRRGDRIEVADEDYDFSI